MKITIYTIKDCAFSKQEKEYLNANKLVFEEKDLETNKDFLTEMLAISNNFAGTPVTRVEKDDGTIAVLKGFTKEEFDTTFGFVPAPTTGSGNPTPTSANDTPIKPTTDSTVSPDPLKSVMDDLQAKVEPFDSTSAPLSASAQGKPTPPVVEQPLASPAGLSAEASAKAEVSTEAGPTDSTVSTPPKATDPAAPSIPDFPAK